MSNTAFAQQADVSSSSSSNHCKLTNMRTAVRPNANNGPTNVEVSFVVADFLGVNDVDQKLDIDLFVTLTWVDSRLRDFAGCKFGKTEVWFPQIVLLNSSNLRALNRNALNRVTVGNGGLVHYQQRYTGDISSYHDLRRFPFDKHRFQIRIAALEANSKELVFIANAKKTWISDTLNIEGWDVKGVEISGGVEKLKASEEDVGVVTLTIKAERNPDYFLYRVMLLLMFVVFMSWAIFWIPPSRFEFQIGLGATSMLTSIAFNLSVANNLPQLGYLTVLDKMLIWAIFLIFLSIVEALVAGLLVIRDRTPQAVKIDRASRLVFPALLFGGWFFFVNVG